MEEKKALLPNQREFSTPFCSVSLHECKCQDCSAKLSPLRLPRRFELNMRYTVIFMTGLGFFFGILVGLLIQLPGVSFPSGQQTINIHYSASNQGGAAATINKRMVAPLGKVKLPKPHRHEKGLSRPQETKSAVVQYTNNSLALKETPHPDAPYLELEKPKVPQPDPEVALPLLSNEIHLTLSIPANRINGKSSDKDSQKSKVLPAGPTPVTKNRSLSDIVDGIYWRPSVEDACVMGFSDEKRSSWRRKAGNLQIIKMEEGCGRMQNRLLTFRDASKACARYRLNTDQIQGDIFSYYLSRLLKIKNLAPSIAMAVQTKHSRWSAIHLDIAESQWMDDQVVVLSQYIEGLQPTFIPKELRGEGLELHPVEKANLTSKSDKELCELAQWSDLIVFDYLVANLDRVVNNMFNKQWNANMMKNPTHNLLKIPSNQQLVFLDNESGLFHGYRLLDKYHVYHETMLKSLCIFRKSTVEALKKLYFAGNVGDMLKDAFVENESYHYLVPSMPEKNIKILKERLGEVYQHIKKCEERYS